MAARAVASVLLAATLSSCTWIAPSLPYSPAAVSANDSSAYVATTGCERRILSVTLKGPDAEYWRIDSEYPAGTLIAAVTIGVTPAGFEEVTPLDPTWIDDELFDRRGASVVFIAHEDEPGLSAMGVFVPADAGYGWLFADTNDGPGGTWEAYRTFVTDEREVGGAACTSVIVEPTT